MPRVGYPSTAVRRALCAGGTQTIFDFGVNPWLPSATYAAGAGLRNNSSHSHRRTRRRWNPNIQTVRAMVGHTRKRMNVCTSCIKAGKVVR